MGPFFLLQVLIQLENILFQGLVFTGHLFKNRLNMEGILSSESAWSNLLLLFGGQGNEQSQESHL